MSKNSTKTQNPQPDRDTVIIRTSIIGIISNIFLAAFKMAVGLLSNSIAVMLDAVNNLSDALSSVITIIGTRLSSRKPDKKHPLGYGRIEYLSTMIIAAIVLYAGITSLVESVKKLLSPEPASYTLLSLLIIGVAVAVKLLLGYYVKRIGKQVNSGSLTASGSDALFDSILSASVLLSAVIYMLRGVSLEAYVGLVISVIIIKSGIEMLRDTLDEILGKRLEGEYLASIKDTICEDEAVSGAFDLILHSYGPEKYIGSVHVEIPDTMTAEEIDLMERRIAQNVFDRHGILLTGIGIYTLNTQSDTVKAMRSHITRLVMAHEGVLQIHGFYVDASQKIISLDVILDYALDKREEVFAQICAELGQAYPEYRLNTTMDIDV